MGDYSEWLQARRAVESREGTEDGEAGENDPDEGVTLPRDSMAFIGSSRCQRICKGCAGR